MVKILFWVMILLYFLCIIQPLRINSIAMFFTFTAVQAKGKADIMVIYKSVAYWFELKAPNGRQRDDQKFFEQRVIRAGCKYWLIKDLTNFMDIMKDIIYGKKINT